MYLQRHPLYRRPDGGRARRQFPGRDHSANRSDKRVRHRNDRVWFDESKNGDTSAYTIPEIIISKAAVGNAVEVTEAVTHSSSLLTDQEIFRTVACLLASCGAADLSAAFLPGSIPNGVPEPASLTLFGFGALALRALRAAAADKAIPSRPDNISAAEVARQHG